MNKDHSRLGSITFGAVARSQKLKSFMLSTKMRRSTWVFRDTKLSISSMNEVSKKKICWKNIFAQDPVLAVEAVRVVDENVDQDQAVILIPLNFFFFLNTFLMSLISWIFSLLLDWWLPTASAKDFFEIQLLSFQVLLLGHALKIKAERENFLLLQNLKLNWWDNHALYIFPCTS